jgi:hypothetical protein
LVCVARQNAEAERKPDKSSATAAPDMTRGLVTPKDMRD